jgi:hypothetical protein
MRKLGKACAHFVLTRGKSELFIRRSQTNTKLGVYTIPISPLLFPAVTTQLSTALHLPLTSLSRALSPISTGPINSRHEEKEEIMNRRSRP